MISIDTFKGMDNRHKAESLPDGFVRDLINIDVDDTGKLSLREGAQLLYAGNIHSLYGNYFIEDGDLKKLNADNTATTLESAVGDSPMTYTVISDTTYFSNGIINGKIRGDAVTRWGVQRPPEQPQGIAITTGDLFAGDYQVAITWIDYDGEESGTPQSNLVSVAAGGGIKLDRFITPPVNIEKIAVYVSQANSETLYLYREYPRSTGSVFIEKGLSDIALKTQFGKQPFPCSIIQEHYGRIYFAKDNHVYYTESQNYGLVMPNNYWAFEDDIQIIASIPNALYVVTKTRTYRITNIDVEGFPIRAEVKQYGGTKGTLTMDTDNKTAYWLSDHGMVAANSEGVMEMHHANVAASTFEVGATTLLEKNGSKRIVGAFQVGNPSSLQDSKYKANELSRNGNAM